MSGEGSAPKPPNRFREPIQFDHGKRIYKNGQLDTIGLSPANFRAGGKKHVGPPFQIFETAKEVIMAQGQQDRPSSSRSVMSARGGGGEHRTPTGGVPGAAPPASAGAGGDPFSPSEADAELASSKKRERKLLESLIAFPSQTSSVPRAFQSKNVDWKPTGEKDHIPPLPEAKPKKPPPKLKVDEENPMFMAVDPRLLKSPRHTKPLKPVPTIHDGKTADPEKLVDRLWQDMENRKIKKAKLERKYTKEENALMKFGGKTKVTDENLEEWLEKYSSQPLHTRQVKHDQLVRKYAPPLHKKNKMGKSQMNASTDRLYYQATKNSSEAHESARRKYVEECAPKFPKLTPDEFNEMSVRLTNPNAEQS